MKAVQRNRAEKKVRPQNGSPIKFHGDSGAQGGGGGGTSHSVIVSTNQPCVYLTMIVVSDNAPHQFKLYRCLVTTSAASKEICDDLRSVALGGSNGEDP